MMSPKPAVTSIPVTAPRRSMTAFVTSVVPCTISVTEPISMRLSATSAATPASTASEGSCGVVKRLWIAMRPPDALLSAKSVKVPPMSTPIRYIQVPLDSLLCAKTCTSVLAWELSEIAQGAPAGRGATGARTRPSMPCSQASRKCTRSTSTATETGLPMSRRSSADPNGDSTRISVPAMETP